MTESWKTQSWGSLLGSMLCVAFAGLLGISIVTWIRDALVLQYDASMRTAVGNARLIGVILATLLLAGALPVRLVAAFCGACYAALIALALVVGSLASWSLLALATLGAAFGLCVWVQLVEQLLPLARHLRHAVAVLAVTLASAVSLIDAGLLTPFLLARPRAGLVVSGCLALVLSLGAANLRAPSERQGVRPESWLGIAIRLLVVGTVVSMAAHATTDTLLDPQHLPTDPSWLQAGGAVTAELTLAAVLLWMFRHQPQTSSLRVIGLTLAVSAALTPACALLASRSWGTPAGFVAAFAGSLASLGRTLLVIVVAPLVPQRFIGPVLGVWFIAGTLALRATSSVTEWARGSGVVTSAIAIAAPALLAACAALLVTSTRLQSIEGGR